MDIKCLRFEAYVVAIRVVAPSISSSEELRDTPDTVTREQLGDFKDLVVPEKTLWVKV